MKAIEPSAVDRVLIVTGGATGIGAASARQAARAGFSIAINYRKREAQALGLVQELTAGGARAFAVQADVSHPRNIEHLFDVVEQKLGRVSALVNSAAVFMPPTRVEDADPDVLARLLGTNVVGVMLCCREAARRMSTRRGGGGGVIVNVSSMAATVGGRPGSSHYAASKAAVDSFSIGFAKEVAREGIRVVSVRPGFTVTDATEGRLSDGDFRDTLARTIPIGRPARVDEVAKPIVWLLSPDASFITGACIDISGGGFSIS